MLRRWPIRGVRVLCGGMGADSQDLNWSTAQEYSSNKDHEKAPTTQITRPQYHRTTQHRTSLIPLRVALPLLA